MKQEPTIVKLNLFGKKVELPGILVTNEPGDVTFWGCLNNGVDFATMVPGNPTRDATLARALDEGWTLQQFCDAVGLKLGAIFSKSGDKPVWQVFRDPREPKPIIVKAR